MCALRIAATAARWDHSIMPMPSALRWMPPLTLAFSLSLSACGDRSSRGSQPSDGLQPADSEAAPSGVLTTGPICAGCETLAGGETSDFTGTPDLRCGPFRIVDAVTFEQAEDIGFDVNAARALLERRFAASFAWKLDRDFIPGDVQNDPGVVSGFLPETRVEGDIELLGTARYGHLDPARCDHGICTSMDGVLQECGYVESELSLDASVDLQTEDGALSLAEIGVQPTFLLGPVTSIPLGFQLDLGALQGTLRLERQHPGPTRGTLQGTLHAHPEGIRGSLQPLLGPVPGDGLTSWNDDAFFRSLVGHWPAEDDCGPGQLPVNDQTDAGREALGLFDQYYPELVALADQTSMSGTWRGPAPFSTPLGFVNLLFEVSSDAQPLCFGGNGLLSFSTQAGVTSADGLLNWTTEVTGGIHSGEGNGSTSDPPFLTIGTTALFQDVDALRRAGLGDLDLLGGTLARVQFGASFVAYPDRVGHAARFDFSSVIPCATDPRCAEYEPEACPFCGTSIMVRRLDSPGAY
jgi:hypothetical protein